MVRHAIDRGVPAMAAATVFGAAPVASLSGLNREGFNVVVHLRTDKSVS